MFNPGYALFSCSAESKTYQPNRASYVNPEHLGYFKFIGQVIGKAVMDGFMLDAHFTRAFYKHILGIAVSSSDLAAADPEYYKQLEWMLSNDIDGVLDLTFCAVRLSTSLSLALSLSLSVLTVLTVSPLSCLLGGRRLWPAAYCRSEARRPQYRRHERQQGRVRASDLRAAHDNIDSVANRRVLAWVLRSGAARFGGGVLRTGARAVDFRSARY
jgi:hypothetical protein